MIGENGNRQKLYWEAARKSMVITAAVENDGSVKQSTSFK